MNLHENIQAKNTDQSDLTHTITNISDTIPISPTPIPNDIMDLLVTPISAPTDTLKDKITEHTSTSIHGMSDMSSDSEEDDYDNIMSGVEELSTHSDDDSTNNELPVTPTLEAIQETNVTLQHSTSKQIRPIVRKKYRQVFTTDHHDNVSSYEKKVNSRESRRCITRQPEDAA